MTIAVLTRTQNRPLLLRRALYCLLNQNKIPDEWIVVLDGGDIENAIPLVKLAKEAGIPTTLIANETARGMEAASNQGLEVIQSEYFVIHDDDDSLEPSYLKKMLNFAIENPEFAAVVSFHNLIIEEIKDNRIKRKSSTPGKLPKSGFEDLLISNQWPPISMIVKKSIAFKLGGFDQTLPVLGDWDFNLKLAKEFQLGILEDYLANYHHREDLSGPNSNTVIAQKELHAEFRGNVLKKYQGRAL